MGEAARSSVSWSDGHPPEVGVGGCLGGGSVTSLIPLPTTKQKRIEYEVIGDCHQELNPSSELYKKIHDKKSKRQKGGMDEAAITDGEVA